MSNQYRNVIALNNMGASLLQRGCCRQAQEVLRDSVSLMKYVIRWVREYEVVGAGKIGCESMELGDTGIDSMIARAVRHMSDPQPEIKIPFSVKVLTYGCCSNDSLKSILWEGPASSVSFAINIEALSSEFQEVDLDVESAIILYNLGTAYQMLSHLASKPEKFHVGALRLFRSSHAIFARQHENENPNSYSQVLHLSVAVLINMVRSLQACARFDEARRAFSILNKFKNMANELNVVIEKLGLTQSCAGAA